MLSAKIRPVKSAFPARPDEAVYSPVRAVTVTALAEERSLDRQAQRATRWRLAALYAGLATLGILTASGRAGTSDGAVMINVTRSIAHRATFEASPCTPEPLSNHCVPGNDGRYYAGFGLLPSALAVPPLVAGEWLAARSGRDPAILSAFLVSLTTAMVGALVPLLLAVWLARLGLPWRPATGAVLVVFLGSVLWYESVKGFYSEPYFTAGLVACACLLSTTSGGIGAAGAGAAFGAAIASRLVGIVFGPVFALYALTVPGSLPFGARLRRVVLFGLGAAPFVLAVAASNYVRFGDVTKTGYHLAYPTPNVLFSTPLGEGLQHVFFDGEVGLLWFSPWVLLVPWAWAVAWRRYRAECVLSMALLGEAVIFFAKYRAWHGGWAYGPRMIAPCLPFVAPALAVLFERMRHRGLVARGAVVSLVALAFVVQIGGAFYPMLRYYQLVTYQKLRGEPAPFGGSLVAAEWIEMPTILRGTPAAGAPDPQAQPPPLETRARTLTADQFLASFDNPANLVSPDLWLWKAATMGSAAKAAALAGVLLASSLALLWLALRPLTTRR